nr:splicing factor, proline- and glutamine-rich [Chlorocebus sabaeus]
MFGTASSSDDESSDLSVRGLSFTEWRNLGVTGGVGLSQCSHCWRTRGWVESITIKREHTHTHTHTSFLLPLLFLSPHPPGGGTLVSRGRFWGGGPGRTAPRRVTGHSRRAWVRAAAAGWPAPRRPLPRFPWPPPPPPPVLLLLFLLPVPHPPPGPRQLRLREQPEAAPRPRSLCLGPPGARGPAQAGHAGTEEAERTGSDGETGEEPAKRHRHHHHQPPLPSPSLTVAHPSSPASPPISYPCAVPTLSDHLLFIGCYFGKATECAKSGISTSAVGHLSSPFRVATSIFPSGKGAQWHFLPLNHTEMAG